MLNLLPTLYFQLVRHSDHILKKSKTSSVENETQLQNFIDLFKYVDDKDLFQKFYSKKLANRLIQNTTISIDTEEFVINGLRVSLVPGLVLA